MDEKTLSLNFRDPYAKPTGDVFDIDSHCTLPLNREITLRRVVGNYGETDRKFWVVLVRLAFDDLGKKHIHETNLRDIATMFRENSGGDTGIKWLMDSARRLSGYRLDWDDDHETGTATLLSGLKIDKSSGKVYYQFGDFLTEKILDNKNFYRLQLHFMLGLSGKYTVSLYMILEGLANLQNPTITIPLSELRQRLNVPDSKLEDWRNFNNRALKPAIEQINEESEKIGFVAGYESISKGRKIEAVKFTVVKTSNREATEKRISRKTGTEQANLSVDNTPAFSAKNYESFKLISSRLDIYAEEIEWRNWCAKNGKIPKRPVAAFIGWLQKKASSTTDKLF